MPTIKGQHLGEHSPSPPLDQLVFLPISMHAFSDITELNNCIGQMILLI